MQRIKAVIAYDGSSFIGFQRQKQTAQTVQGRLEEALESMGIFTPIVGSGRTDRGVHASGQVIHFDLPSYWVKQPLLKLQNQLNYRLDGIKIKHISPVSNNFHARYDATKRIYRYCFKSNPSIFERNYVAKLYIKDTNLLQEALESFIGEHDFSYFLKSGSQTKHNIRRVFRAYYIERKGYSYIYFYANGFLRAQVRMMIYSASMVANGELALKELKEQLTLKRRYTTKLAPPQGLYLARVIYPNPPKTL